MVGRPRRVPGTPCKYGHTPERYPSGACVECTRLRGREHDKTSARKAQKNRRRRERRQTDPAYVERLNLQQRDQLRRRRERDPEFRTNRIAELRRWKLENPKQHRISKRLHRQRQRGAEGRYIQEDLDRIFRLQRGRCAYCRHRLKAYEVDHIVPLCRGGSNWPHNLQLTCVAGCNQDKGALDALEYARSLGRLV